MRRDERVFRLMLFVSPLLFLATWLHGLLFAPPSHWAQTEPQHFIAVWFRTHPAAFYFDYARELLALSIPVVLVTSWLLYRGARLADHAWNRRTAAIGFALQVAGWLLLRPLAAALLDVAVALRTHALGAALAAEAQALAIPLCAAAPVLGIAFMFARLSIEANARKKPRRVRATPPRLPQHAAPRRA
jgi:hypothetical protein